MNEVLMYKRWLEVTNFKGPYLKASTGGRGDHELARVCSPTASNTIQLQVFNRGAFTRGFTRTNMYRILGV